jgi:DNA-binding NtrC family response regulator
VKKLQLDPVDFPVNTSRREIVLAGLEQKVADELGSYLRTRGLSVKSCEKLDSLDADQTDNCALAFCDIGQSDLMAMLKAVKMPVVVVSRLPEVNDWLDAIEAGAADYCSAPIEREQIDWILESNLPGRGMGRAAA